VSWDEASLLWGVKGSTVSVPPALKSHHTLFTNGTILRTSSNNYLMILFFYIYRNVAISLTLEVKKLTPFIVDRLNDK
jgi:hypothetical protein